MLTSEALPKIESALTRRGIDLRFPAELESEFYAQRAPRHTGKIRCFFFLAIALEVLSLICDALARLPLLRFAVLCQAGICIPLTLLSIRLIDHRVPRPLRAWASVLPMILNTVLVGVLARLVNAPVAPQIMLVPALWIFVQTLIAPIPFRIALRGLLVSLAAYTALCLTHWPGLLGPPCGPVAPTFACGAGLLALYERYRREHADRIDFLLSEANRLRMESILNANAHLERLSTMDGLTGVFNRRYLDAALARLWQLAESHQRWIGILMVDIDNFKMLNDTNGHQHGDFCLEQVAQIVQASVREGIDTVARYGGEEFVAILPEADEQEALTVGERIRTSVEAANLPAPNGARVTVSLGAAAIRCGLASRLTLQELIASADQALYQAKRAGRNRVLVSAPAPPPDSFPVNLLTS